MSGPVDLVLGGGGVRGVALVGALAGFEEAGWTPHRIAGASAGAMAGALAVAGATPAEQRGYLNNLDYRGFVGSDLIARLVKRPFVGAVVDRFGTDRVEPLAWMSELLANQGVESWADLALTGKDAEGLPPEKRYRLVVRCLDVVHRRVVRLPWDYDLYGLEAASQSVAQAVRASMSVPIIYDPVTLGVGDKRGLLVDGGLGAGFSAAALDRLDAGAPRHPSFAVKLTSRLKPDAWPEGDLALMRAMLDTVLETGDRVEPESARDGRRTIRIDASSVSPLDLRVTTSETDALYDQGLEAVRSFLAQWQEEPVS